MLLRRLRRKSRGGAAWALWHLVVMHRSVVGVCCDWPAGLDSEQALLEFATLVVECSVEVCNETLLTCVVALLLCDATLLLCSALCSVALLLGDAALLLRGTLRSVAFLLCSALCSARGVGRAKLLDFVEHECDCRLHC